MTRSCVMDPLKVLLLVDLAVFAIARCKIELLTKTIIGLTPAYFLFFRYSQVNHALVVMNVVNQISLNLDHEPLLFMRPWLFGTSTCYEILIFCN